MPTNNTQLHTLSDQETEVTESPSAARSQSFVTCKIKQDGKQPSAFTINNTIGMIVKG